MARKRGDDGLGEYRRKRSADRSPEPFTGRGVARPRLFVVQKHAARNLHFDLRLEMDGVLQSWAVPKGPSLDPEDKRLAVLVEEHPLDYAEFEGLIPEGNYGAGAVIVWDRGRWDPIGDARKGLREGKLLFDLHGYKLRGRWTLFRIKRESTEWLLMKKPDGEAGAGRELEQRSIRSGLTVEQVRDGYDAGARLYREVARLDPPPREFTLRSLEPMLGRVRSSPFDEPGWIFEIKYDGYRLLAERDGERVRLRFRGGHDATAVFPEIVRAISALPHDAFLVDGEVVVLDEHGKPSFQHLQKRVRLRRGREIAGATVSVPATYFVFDLLGYGDRDLRPLGLRDRKRLLERVLPPLGALRYCDHITRRGGETYDAVRRMGLEGVMAKRADSPYLGGRSDAWLKIRAYRSGAFAIVGYSPPKRARAGFGALHCAGWDGRRLVYAGRVGTGFSVRQAGRLLDRLSRSQVPRPACEGAPDEKGQVWVAPELVCEVRYKEWTQGGLLRQPVFVEERPDTSVEDCTAPPAAPDAPVAATVVEPHEPQPSLTNLAKVFWPEEGYTKGDLIDYYRSVSRWILPYLRDRPVVSTRHPDGIEGKSFFQKDAPGFVPSWIRVEKMWSEHAEREIHYFVCDDERSLIYLINLGTIPLHLWASRTSSLGRPDWSILDLDPKGAAFEHVVRIARAIRALCREIGLPSYVKTSGSTGLHVLVPLDARCTFEQSRNLAELLARIVAAELPDIATIARSPRARHGRVYLDYLQNGHGKLLVAPFCVRPLAGAPVSTPLRWSEVRPSLDIGRFTIRSVPRRMRAAKNDPMRELLGTRVDLRGILERLEKRLDERE